MTSRLKIGFDLDGVLLYNPARIFRPVTLFLKAFLKQKPQTQTQFYLPKTWFEELVWNVVHWSSLFIAPGYQKVQTLIHAGDIEGYIITSRYDCLYRDFMRWLHKLNASSYFKGSYHNKSNMQPHEFKAQMIQKLKLDYFIEDNWDIVEYINAHTQAKGIWITNILDRSIPYDLKFKSLNEAMEYIKKEIHRDS